MIDKKVCKTGFLVALKQEIPPLTRGRDIPQNGPLFNLSGNIWVRLTGMGAANAAKAAQELISDDFSLLISWGTATALGDDLDTGTLCVPKTIITKSNEKLTVNRELLQMVRRKAGNEWPLVTSSLAEARQVLSTRDEKHALYAKTQAPAADMESGAIAKTAAEHEVAFLAIRAISDGNNTHVPQSVIRSTAGGELKIGSLLKQLAVSPADWLPIIQLASGFRKAQKTLSATARQLIPLLDAEYHQNVI